MHGPFLLPAQDPTEQPLICVIAVAFEKFGQLKVFVQSWINQTQGNWHLTVIHDGENSEFNSIMAEFAQQEPERIAFFHTENRFNDYGHSLRDIGLRSAKGDYVLITNADNYYVPKTVEFLTEALGESTDNPPDVVMFDMIHSHRNPGGRDIPSYGFFEVSYKINHIDMGAAMVEIGLAQETGFNDRSFAADAVYFSDVLKTKVQSGSQLQIRKIPRVLLVHN